MITIDRLNGVEATVLLPQIVEHLVMEDHEKPGFLETLRQALVSRSEEVLFIVAVQEHAVIGFTIAQQTPQSVYVSQMWSLPSNGWKVADEMFLRVILWAVGLGKKAIHAHTKRDVESLYRRVGFEEKAVILERKIDQTMLNELFSQARKVFSNG